MKIRHIILGIGALAAGAAVLYYLTKEKAVAEVQPASVKETPPAEPEVSEEDKAILDDIFEPEECRFGFQTGPGKQTYRAV